MANTKVQSIEPNIADMANGWLKSYGLNYKLEQESLNDAIDTALDDYYNKVTDLPLYSYKNKLGGWNIVQNK